MTRTDFDLRNFDETEVDVTGKDWKDPDVFRIWSKNTLVVEKQREYWRPYIETGKTCMDYYRGRIFDDETRDNYENVEDKYVVEPQKIKPAVNALVGELINKKRSGRVEVEGGTLDAKASRSAEILTVNMVLKHMERRWGIPNLLNDVLLNSMVAAYPVWIWFQQTALSDIPELGPQHPVVLDWDSTYPSPFNFKSPVGQDIIGLTRHQKMSTEDILDMWPEQEDVVWQWLEEVKSLQRHGTINFDHMDNWDTPHTAAQRDRLIFSATTGIDTVLAPDGYWDVYERNFQIRREEVVAVNLFNPENIIIRPPTWDEREWREFLNAEKSNQNTDFSEHVRPVKILWTTCFCEAGLVFSNGPSWFQCHGMLPGVPIVPAMIDSVPSGPVQDMMPDALAMAVAATEYLDDLRKNTGSVTAVRDGTIANADDFASEMNKAHGYIALRAEAPPIDNCIKEFKRTPNPAFADYEARREQSMHHSAMINPNMMGMTIADQSGRAKELEIGRALITQSIYVTTWNAFVVAFNNLLLRIMPLVYDRYDIIDIEDEKTGQKKIQEINIPDVDGIGPHNDLTSHKYKWVMTLTDDSPTAKQEEYRQAVVFLNAVPGPVVNADPSGKLLARFMMAMPNRFLNEAGAALAKDAELRMEGASEEQKRKDLAELQKIMAELKINAEKAKRMGVNLTVTGEQLAQFPQLVDYLQQFFGTTAPQQPQPTAQPQPEMAPA